MLRPNLSMRSGRFGSIVAAAVVATAFTGGDLVARDGACKYDVKPVPPVSTCLRSTWCGGAGGTISYGGVTVGKSTGGSVECCLTEVVEPAHTMIVKGDKKIVHVSDVQGTLITRKCTGPFVLFWIEFGSWECAVDSITPFGTYSIDRAEDCE